MAAPRTNTARESVQLIREAIEMYKSQDPNNAYPSGATLTTALQPYLKGPFPVCPIGQQTATVFALHGQPAGDERHGRRLALQPGDRGFCDQ